MSVKLVKKSRRKTYQIQVYLQKQKKVKWINTYCTNKKDAQAILKQYQLADIEYKLGLRESQLPNDDIPTLTGVMSDKPQLFFNSNVKSAPQEGSNNKRLLPATWHKPLMSNTFAELRL